MTYAISDHRLVRNGVHVRLAASNITQPDADGGGAMRQDWQINGERKWQLSIYLA